MKFISKNTCILIATLYLAITSLGLLAFVPLQPISAQSPPLSPPPPSGGNNPSGSIIRQANDNTPPVIEVITHDLKEGKNVIAVTITDESSITSRTVQYVSQGKIRISDIARDEGNRYSALINVKGPTAIVVFEAIDANGNMGKTVKEFSVAPASTNFFEQFLEWLTSLFA